MSSRDRTTTGAAATSGAPASFASHCTSLSAQAAPARPVSWEHWFQYASAAQRTELLDLAQRQGLLYARQLPSLNGNRDSAHPSHSVDHPALLTSLLAGKTETIPHVASASLSTQDA